MGGWVVCKVIFVFNPTPRLCKVEVELSSSWDFDKKFEIKWSVIDRAPDFNSAIDERRLCMKEKF